MKILPTILSLLLLATGAYASATLYEYYNGDLPTIEERAVIYGKNVDNRYGYTGTVTENNALLKYLKSQEVELFGAAAFPASSEFATTTGWADDGIIVRLDNSSDSVGIGTTTPAEKLGISGSFFLEEDNATTTLNLSTGSDTVGSCIQMKSSNGRTFKLVVNGESTTLLLEAGSCQ